MRIIRKTPQVFLSGGLGNQLFQLAAALANSSGPIILNGSLGYPRSDAHNAPDLMKFVLPSRAKIINFRDYPVVVRNISNFLLRASSSSKMKPNHLKRKIIVLTGGSILSFYFREFKKVCLAHGTGLCEVGSLTESSLLFGFFHTCVFPKRLNQTRDDLRNIHLSRPSQELSSLIKSISHQKILVVHIRLGDYAKEPQLGILPPTYFADAIEKAFNENDYDVIWIFSASPELAMHYVPKTYHPKTKMMEGTLKEPAETLELMRYGDGFILSNSTFSWWGAFLSYKKNPRIYAPKPWFKSATNPLSIIPDEWGTIEW